jgi:hypothetical protein
MAPVINACETLPLSYTTRAGKPKTASLCEGNAAGKCGVGAGCPGVAVPPAPGTWSSDRATAHPTPPHLTPPRRTRSREPKPFAGLTRKPPCDACEHSGVSRPQPPSSPPPHLVPSRGDTVRSTPHTISAPIRTVPIGAGWAGAISAPMAIPVAVPGGSCCVEAVAAIFSESSQPGASGRSFPPA